VLNQILQTKLSELKYEISCVNEHNFIKAVVVKVLGEINGNAILEFDNEFNRIISKKMWGSFDPESAENLDDSMIKESLQELANMVVGNTTTVLYNKFKIKTDIQPPVLLSDKTLKNSEKICISKITLHFQYNRNFHKTHIFFIT
jgi:CheY-specific phosphatase CheX